MFDQRKTRLAQKEVNKASLNPESCYLYAVTWIAQPAPVVCAEAHKNKLNNCLINALKVLTKTKRLLDKKEKKL